MPWSICDPVVTWAVTECQMPGEAVLPVTCPDFPLRLSDHGFIGSWWPICRLVRAGAVTAKRFFGVLWPFFNVENVNRMFNIARNIL